MDEINNFIKKAQSQTGCREDYLALVYDNQEHLMKLYDYAWEYLLKRRKEIKEAHDAYEYRYRWAQEQVHRLQDQSFDVAAVKNSLEDVTPTADEV